MRIDGVSGGGMRPVQAWQIRREAIQASEPDSRQFEVEDQIPDVDAHGAVSGMAALETSRRIAEVRDTTVQNVGALDQTGMSQHNLVNLEMQKLPVLWQDENLIQPRALRDKLDPP